MPFRLPDPDIQTGQWDQVKDGVQRNFDALAAAAIGTGNVAREIRAGYVTLTWAGAVGSGVVAVSHGMGRVPQGVVATAFASPQSVAGQIPEPNVFTLTATTFSIDAEVRVAYTGTQTLFWIAIG